MEKFGRNTVTVNFWDVLPEYSRVNVLRRMMEIGKFLRLPESIYNNSMDFIYVSSQLEKDLIHEQNLKNVQRTQHAYNNPKNKVNIKRR